METPIENTAAPAVDLPRLVRPWRGLLTSLRWTLRYWRALRRLRWNVCPRCNSDSPEFWECPCCLGYDRTTQGMPCEDIKLIWHNKWMTEDRYEQRANDQVSNRGSEDEH